MSAFNKKRLESIESLGEKLRRHRITNGYTIKKVADSMKINARYLTMIEADEFDKLPPGIYTRKFLEQYAKFLNLNPETVILIFEKEKNIYQKMQEVKAISVADNWFQKFYKFLLRPTTLRYAFFFLIIAVVVAYLGVSVNKIFSPPELIIKNPQQTSLITSERRLTLEGITEREVDLTVNGKQVLTDEQGKFYLEIDLQKGLNVIKISAKKKYSQPREVYRQIIVNDQ